MSQSENFWARRKAAVQAEVEQDDAALIAEAEAETRAELEQKTDAEILQELDLPDPETLEPGDDIAGFMKQVVPERLRRRALRRFWRLNPVLANVDGLVDYGEDYTDAANVIENMQTAYQVGKGMLAHVQELARQAEEAENPSETEAEEDVDPAQVLVAQDTLPPEDPANSATHTTKVLYADDAEPAHADAEIEIAATARPPRMRFEFEG